LHHVVLERWSRGSSFLHRRDARAKILALLAFLIVVATTRRGFEALAGFYLVLLLAAVISAALPVAGMLRRAAVVLPFSLTFAAISWLSGEPRQALVLIGKGYLSALAALLLVSTTPLPQLLRGLEMLGVPGFLLMVAQFLYRYLFVIVEQAHRMRLAGLCRGGLKRRSGGFRAAAGALGVLFARSYERAERIHRSMVARGFQGHFQLLSSARFGLADAGFVCIAAGLPLAASLSARIWG
jgi:cobalt/nickel transport system permease protein